MISPAHLRSALALATALLLTPAAQAQDIIKHRVNAEGHAYQPTAGSTSALTSPLKNHGGPTVGTPTVYLIWYGNWAQSNGTDNSGGQQILADFFNAVGGSPYFKINSTYAGSSSAITGNVTYGGATTTSGYPYGSSLTDANIQSIVADAINSARLPSDLNGIYFVLTSSDVNESSGFCSQYCGWHTHGTVNGQNLRYAFVGNAARCITSCAAQSTSPNGNAGVDGMVSVCAHELEEATSDADGSAWYNRRGSENGDLCAWTFGSTYQVANGSWANMKLGTRDFLIQRNVKMTSSGQFCLLQ